MTIPAFGMQPGPARSTLSRAGALVAARRFDEALVCLRQAVSQFPNDADVWNELGAVQRRLLMNDEAAQSFQRALQIDPEQRAALGNFAQTLQILHRYEDAALVFERLWQVWPEGELIGGQLLHCKMLVCDWLRLDALRARVEADLQAGKLVAEPFGIQGYCTSPALLRRCAEAFAAVFYPDRSTQLAPARIGTGAKIRVGYVSGEFRQQATAILLTELLEHHDRSRFEIHAFDNGWDDGSDHRRRIVSCVDSFTSIVGFSDLDAASLVRERRIDILVDLNGYFGHARTGLFALRPAPIQVSYLGFPGTMGVSYIDYLLADDRVIPEAQRAHYAEAIAYLPDSYQPNDSSRRASTERFDRGAARLPESGFVFCCFNNSYKILPEVFDIWMRLLRRVPGSVLWFYSPSAAVSANLQLEAEARGIEPARLIPAPHLEPERHLARLRLADLFLDTWPYNAHTTGSDALWAGVPVVTCTGETFPSRVGASLLSAMEMPELITTNFAEYEAMAFRLATEPSALSRLREKLAANRANAPLMDTPRLRRHVEAAFVSMVRRARSGLRPESFHVEAQPDL